MLLLLHDSVSWWAGVVFARIHRNKTSGPDVLANNVLRALSKSLFLAALLVALLSRSEMAMMSEKGILSIGLIVLFNSYLAQTVGAFWSAIVIKVATRRAKQAV